MKLKSLILGSIAAAGLSTAGFAADLGVLTSLDVCDELGLSGLTISSDTNCLQISGEVKYEFSWGNYANSVGNTGIAATHFGTRSVDTPSNLAAPLANADWNSKVEAWLKFVGTAGSDFGPASVVIKIKEVQHRTATDGGSYVAGVFNAATAVGGDNAAVNFDEAYVQVGDTTVLTAGKRGSIFNKGDDEPFNFTGLFISSAVDAGVANQAGALPGFVAPAVGAAGPKTGGHVIQLWSNVGEGLIAKIGLENLNDAVGTSAGTVVGVLDYSGAGITAHISGAAGGILDGVTTADDTYAMHAGFTGTFDQFRIRAALGAGGRATIAGVTNNYWNALVTGEAKFDMFKVALSAEASNATVNSVDQLTDYGFGASVGATVSEGIEINLGGRYFNDGTANIGDGYQVAVQLVAALTETVKLTGEVGVYGKAADVLPAVGPAVSDFYGKAELAWNPGGGFSSSVGATVQQNGAYKVTFKAAKAFQ